MKLFGTDGIRGQANIFPMTVENVMRIGQALGLLLQEHKIKKVLIGKDTRLSGYMFENALSSGLTSTGVDALLVGPMPTPAISYLTESMRAQAGVMISASHNPYRDNGIKIFGSDGFKISDETEAEIEYLLVNPEKIEEKLKAESIGKAYRLDDAQGRYISHLKYHFPQKYDLVGYKVVIDCANGAAYKIAPTIFEELGAQCHVVENKPNGKNINDQCGAVYPQRLQREVLNQKANFGVSLDGDADRLVMCDELGNILDGDDLLYVIVQSMIEEGKKPKGVVGTLMSNMALEKFCHEQDVEFVRAKVGDRYVVECMREKQWCIGGESSGHLIYLPNCNTGDGIMNALLVSTVLCRTQETLSSLVQKFNKFPQVLVNINVEEKKPIESCELLFQAIAEVESDLGDFGRVLVRYSGTENKLRIMVEGQDQFTVDSHIKKLVEIAQVELGLKS